MDNFAKSFSVPKLLAYNFPWELAKIDRLIYGETECENSMTREEIMRDYAEYAQQQQDYDKGQGWYLPNSVLVRPILNLFSGEYEGGSFRKTLVENASNKVVYGGKIRQCILDTMEYYRGFNPEGLQTRNGVKVVRPQSMYEKIHRKAKAGTSPERSQGESPSE